MARVPGVTVEAGVEAAVAQFQATEHELRAIEQVRGQVRPVYLPHHSCVPVGCPTWQSHIRAQALVLHVGCLCGGGEDTEQKEQVTAVLGGEPVNVHA